MGNIPPSIAIPQTTRLIVAFMPNVGAAELVVDRLPDTNEVGSELRILGGATNQGRHQIRIEGSMSRAIAQRILQTIDAIGGDIQAVGG